MQHPVSVQTSSPASSAPLGASRWSPATTEHAFDGTIASACKSIGISPEQLLEMAQLAERSDARVGRFIGAWNALGASEWQAKGAADAVCEQVGLAPIALLQLAAEAAFRFSMYVAQFKAALALPSIVERSIQTALTDDGSADRKILFQHTGFLPTPKGSQTTIAITQNAQANATSRPIVAAPSPEHTIRRLTDRFNEIRGLPRSPAARNIDALRVPLPDGVEEDEK